jgi:hypothetical protein
MYFVNSVAYNGLQGAQSREGHLNLAVAVGIGKVEGRCDHESLFVCRSVHGLRSGLLGMSYMLE